MPCLRAGEAGQGMVGRQGREAGQGGRGAALWQVATVPLGREAGGLRCRWRPGCLWVGRASQAASWSVQPWPRYTFLQ